MPIVKVNDISCYYEVHGASGSPVIMIMGFGASKATWLLEDVQGLAARHRVIIFDNRGAGQSSRPRSPYGMVDFAADTVGLLDAMGIGRAHVLGLSMGGMIAQHVAIRYPERVLGLVLGCTVACWQTMVPPAPEALAILTKPPSGNRAQDIRDQWPILYTPVYIAGNRAQLERQMQDELAYPAPSADDLELQLGAVLSTHDTTAHLPALCCPTLVQTGRDDSIIPAENSQLIARLIPHAQDIEYPNCGHMFFEEAVGQWLDDTLAFLDSVDRSLGRTGFEERQSGSSCAAVRQGL